MAGAAESPEPVIIQSDELEVAGESEATMQVEVKNIPKNSDAVLEFTAWHRASKHAGYYTSMRVFWDGEEMEDILDRPEKFEVRMGPDKTRTVTVRAAKYWKVAVLPDPESSQDSTQPYYISADEVDVVHFRFRLPKLTPGNHELIIRNNMKDNLPGVEYELFPTLMLRNVAIQWVAK